MCNQSTRLPLFIIESHRVPSASFDYILLYFSIHTYKVQFFFFFLFNLLVFHPYFSFSIFFVNKLQYALHFITLYCIVYRFIV